MKMKKILPILVMFLVVSSFVFPPKAQAAWWNIFSWTKKENQKSNVVKIVAHSTTTPVNSSSSIASSLSSSSANFSLSPKKEAVKQKTNINKESSTQYTDNQSAKIEKLKKQVEELKNKVNTAQKQQTLIPHPIAYSTGSIKEKIQYIVQIVCPVNGGNMSGTGEIIYGNSSTDNKVVTNKHVLNGAIGPCGVYRTLNYESQPTLYFKSANTFVFSKNYDLAVITPDTSKLTAYTNTNVEFNEDSDILDRVIFVLGYPASAGNNITLTKGIISGTENIDGIAMYKTDAKIDSGNSGGAVFDENGKFIGIPTLASQGNFASYGYIIPAKVVKNFLDIVEQEGYGKQNWQHPELSLYSVSPSNTVPEISPRTPQNPAPNEQERQIQLQQEQEIEQKTVSIKNSISTLTQLENNCEKAIQDSNTETTRLRSLLGGQDHYDILQKIWVQENYQRLALDECVGKKIRIIDNLIPDIRALLRIPNLPSQATSIMNQFLDVITLKRQRLVDWQYQYR